MKRPTAAPALVLLMAKDGYSRLTKGWASAVCFARASVCCDPVASSLGQINQGIELCCHELKKNFFRLACSENKSDVDSAKVIQKYLEINDGGLLSITIAASVLVAGSSKVTASDRRIGQRTPWNLAREIVLQEGRIGKPSAGGKSSPQRTHDALKEELLALVGEGRRCVFWCRQGPKSSNKWQRR